MILAYFWIKDFRNINNQGFNLTNDLDFDVTYTKGDAVLTISTKKDIVKLPTGFFSRKNVKNVHAIVGENGSGKTSLLESLLETRQDFDVFKVDSKSLLLQKYYPDDLIINNNSDYQISVNNVEKKDYSEKYKIILYSNVLEGKKYNPVKQKSSRVKSINLTTDFLLQSLSSYSLNKSVSDVSYNVFDNYLLDQMKRQIWFVAKFKDKLQFKLPDKMLLFFKFELDVKGIVDPVVKFISENKVSLQDRIIIFSLVEYFYNEKFSSKESSSYWDDLLGFMFKIFKGEFINYNSNTFKDDVFRILVQDYKFDQKYIAKLNTLLDELFQIVGGKIYINTPVLKIDISNDILKSFIESYIQIVGPRKGFITFRWEGLSAGEIAYLNIFSRLSLMRIPYLHPSTHSDLINSNQGLIFLFDEPESGFHPQWQKNFFSDLMQILPSIYPKNNIQILVSSHSPFICSNLPKSNIVFLEKW